MLRFIAQIGTIALVAVLGIALVGCSAADQPSLDGTEWTLVAWSVSSQKATDFPITLSFEGDKLGGQAPVNSYGGTYEASGGSLTLGDVNRTLMAGSPEADRAENAYFGLLEQAERYEVEDGRLKLLDGAGNELLTFEAAE